MNEFIVNFIKTWWCFIIILSKFSSITLILVFCLIYVYSASGKPLKNESSNITFSEYLNQKFYSEEEISNFEQETGIEIPKLVKEIYTCKFDFKNLIFKSEKNKKLEIQKIFSLEEIKSVFWGHSSSTPGYIRPPSKNAIIFALDSDDEYIFGDDNHIWLYDHEYNRCTHKFTIS
ncbi:MAG: hypothetical protein RsTaC01_0921 [Candidatus Paraimprobicoccus trichonymphae]|uniref:Knr4/Smi1-like domain-containing protein n=1 Tax=Candidatus Paraimprobicoccus trichonymphae TaxID=3033793 RepID=A0AA48KY19_9FIRM|nr:MAG: hypothetical protein RsTaC01_0921 [Candidatus Paraimprobicoccus trichonymphae]